MKKKIVGFLLVMLFFLSIYGNANIIDLDDYDLIELQSTYNDPPGEWMKIYGGKYHTRPFGLTTTDDGGFFLTGYKSFSDGNYLWFLKTDENGDELWNKTYGGSYSELGWGVIQTSDGGFLIVGRTTSSFDEYYTDAWLVKTDENGNVLWEKTYGENLMDRGYSVLETEDGGFIFVGMKDGDDLVWQYGNIWIVKTTSNGDVIWETSFMGTEKVDIGYKIRSTSDGGYIIAGCHGYYYDDDTEEGGGDIWLIKIDSEGNKLWENIFGEDNSLEYGWSVDTTIDGGYVLVGHTDYGNHVLIKTDSDGNKEWQKLLGEDEYWYHWACRVTQTIDGGYVISGSCRENTSEKPKNYVMLIQTDSEGNMRWSRKFCEGTSRDYSYSHASIQLDDGSYVLTAYSTVFYSGWDMNKISSCVFIKVVDIPPFKPNRPVGEVNGKSGEEYTYTTMTTDSDGDQIFYMFDWGEGNTSGWLGPYASGEQCEASYSWDEQYTYQIRVKAKDQYGVESLWSDPLEVAMPRIRLFHPMEWFIAKILEWFPELEPLLNHLIG